MAVNGIQSHAQETYKTNHLISQVGKQNSTSALEASEAFLKRKIAERQEQKAEQKKEFAARIEISQEAQDAWKTRSFKARQEEQKTAETDDNRKFFADQYTREAQSTRQKNSGSGILSKVGSKLDIVA